MIFKRTIKLYEKENNNKVCFTSIIIRRICSVGVRCTAFAICEAAPN